MAVVAGDRNYRFCNLRFFKFGTTNSPKYDESFTETGKR